MFLLLLRIEFFSHASTKDTSCHVTLLFWRLISSVFLHYISVFTLHIFDPNLFHESLSGVFTCTNLRERCLLTHPAAMLESPGRGFTVQRLQRHYSSSLTTLTSMTNNVSLAEKVCFELLFFFFFVSSVPWTYPFYLRSVSLWDF